MTGSMDEAISSGRLQKLLRINFADMSRPAP
jgi:hypothetical protein